MVSRKRSRKGKASKRKTDKQRCFDWLDNHRGEEYVAKEVSIRNRGVSYDSARKNLRRLANDPQSPIIARECGNATFYKIPTGIQTEEDISDLEKQLGELIALDPQEPPEYHNIQLYIKKEDWDKTVAPLPGRLKSFFSANPLDPKTPTQLWPKHNITKSLKGGFQETIQLGLREIIFQVFSSGKINIYIKSSELPIDLEDWPAVQSWVSGVLYARCGVSLDDVRPATTVCWEWARDYFNDALQGALTGSGKFSVTLDTFDDMTHRIYTKHFKDGRIALRSEMAINEPQPMSEFLRANIVQQMGGVSQQYLVREMTEQHRTLQNINQSLEIRDNAINLNMENNRRLSQTMTDMDTKLDTIAKGIGIDLKTGKKKPKRN